MHFNARDLVNLSEPEILSTLPETMEVLFEDGISVNTTDRKVIYSWYFWKINRQYPLTPITSKHIVDGVLNKKPLTANTHRDLLTNIQRSVIQSYSLYRPEQTEHLLELIYEVTNDVHNSINIFAEEYVTSIDILDFIEIVEHDIIKKVVDSTPATHEGISNTLEVLLDVIKTNASLNHNALAKAVRTGMVNANQVAQCVGIRGYVTEVDGKLLPNPIMTNFTKGLHRVYDYVAESLTAAKSLYYAEAPLEDAEYFARRMQLLCMVVERLHYEDCGSTTYLPWRVNGPTYSEKGTVIYPGDLKFMLGKHYLCPETNALKTITHDDPALYNKVLQLRSVLHCKHPDRHGVCAVCYGGLANNISRFSNLGHICSSTMTNQSSQKVLSAKHYMASSEGSTITLTSVSSLFFTTDNKKNSYILKKEYKDRSLRMTVKKDEAVGLSDVQEIKCIDDIYPFRVSSISCISLTAMHGCEERVTDVFVNQGDSKASLTKDFLKYVRVNGWIVDSLNNYVFDLSKWDFEKPIMTLPEVEYSYSDHSKQIAVMIESNMKNITNRQKPNSPTSTLVELFNLVNSKLEVNIAALEVIIYAIMVPDGDRYGLSRGSEAPMLGVADAVIKNRSLGTSYAYEYMMATIGDPKSYFKLDRPDSVLDVFFHPREVVEAYK